MPTEFKRIGKSNGLDFQQVMQFYSKAAFANRKSSFLRVKRFYAQAFPLGGVESPQPA
jgi:hypothetical protein